MDETTGTLKAIDDLELFTRTWTPESDATRGMLIVHGLAEHSGRWGHVARFFVDQGYAVTAFDLRGQGQSGGTKGHVRSFGEYLDDVQSVVESELVRTDLPWVIYAHSLGGFITASYLGEDRPHPDAAVLSAPALAGPGLSSIPDFCSPSRWWSTNSGKNAIRWIKSWRMPSEGPIHPARISLSSGPASS